MKHFILLFVIFCICFVQTAFANTVKWSGEVNADGTPTQNVQLTLGKKYLIKVTGVVNLGKWWQQGKALGNDACFEFESKNLIPPKPLETLNNSLQISVCDGKYHTDHIYHSKPFVAAQSGIHFWIYDIDYSDNSGSLSVEVIELE